MIVFICLNTWLSLTHGPVSALSQLTIYHHFLFFQSRSFQNALWCCSENKSRLTITCKLTVNEQVTLNFPSNSSLKFHSWRFILLCAECWNKICLCAVTGALLCVHLPRTGFIRFLERRFDQHIFAHKCSYWKKCVLKLKLFRLAETFLFCRLANRCIGLGLRDCSRNVSRTVCKMIGWNVMGPGPVSGGWTNNMAPKFTTLHSWTLVIFDGTMVTFIKSQ